MQSLQIWTGLPDPECLTVMCLLFLAYHVSRRVRGRIMDGDSEWHTSIVKIWKDMQDTMADRRQ